MGSLARYVLTAAAVLATAAVGAPASAKCEMQQLAGLPVTFADHRLLVDAKIDGHPVKLILDTGAAQTIAFAPALRRLGLRVAERGGVGRGVGGEFRMLSATLLDLRIGDVDVRDMTLAAVDARMEADDIVMLLGQDVLSHWDVEYDLAHGAVRLLHPTGCRGDDVAYWADAYAKAPLQRSMQDPDRLNVDARLGAAGVQAIIDTGSPFSLATPQAAARAGGVAVGTTTGETGGLGAARSKAQPTRFSEFALGPETIRDPTILVADIFRQNRHAATGSIVAERDDEQDMILGLDFVRAHRILVAPDQGMIYFTYAGGPVFDTSAPTSAEPKAAPKPSPKPEPTSPARP